ncbi:efflux RND transporter periplasmic adaptor subunit [Maridesulfovibrio hydrothermalis]|uniref:Efflux transporter, RND family, MFP subunit n=1 Tax=Maridesulfovibrio hydrothermalis AM13 = DSM 14728 TaxID=1121451 RepID=L0R659_9BACT|nr:efflux RND transporter periplasmic adaptor subunit [Maridesulfovibrio hydrothermalis]CCO22178.1 Efflux transporter, RND family, MFP subunit [Maridesulfovibrio hydrothermalis AM13 = DSM 14728]
MKKLIFILILMTGISLVGCKEKPVQEAQILRPVKTMQVGEFGSSRQWVFSGTAEDALQSELSFRVGGKIISFPGDQIGRKFRAGEVIARLDPADYELEVRQSESNLEQVRANFIRAKADVDRIKQLYERKVVSKSELDQSEADYKSFQAQLNASAKKLDISRKRLKYTVLKAPFDGWVSAVHVNVHQNVQSGQEVISFNAGKQMKMYISLPDTLISGVTEGENVLVTFDALPGKVMKGVIMEVGIGTNSGSSFPVKVYLDNSDQIIRSGMSGNVMFSGRGSSNSIFVAPSAVVGNPDGSKHVWIVENGSTVKRRKVTVGSLSSNGIQVKEGLKPGETVVIRGVHSLKDGMQVRSMGGLS